MISGLIMALTVASTAMPVAAEELPVDTLADRDFSLEEIVVTGTRAPKMLKDTPVQTTLITSGDIERTDATDIEDLLRQEIPGIEFSYTMNQQTHMNFGGFGGQGILFLVDGERMAGETMDDIDFGRLDMSGVDRIEIVRGASSALYGSNATGGIVNVITKEPYDKWHGKVSARIAKHLEQRYRASLSFRNKKFSNLLAASYSSIKSYDVHSSPDAATRVFATVYGNRTLNIHDQFSYSPFDNLKFSARAGYYFREIPRISDTPERYRDYSAGLSGVWNITDATTLNISYSFDQYDKSSYMKITGLDVRNYSNVQNSLRGVLNHTFAWGDVLTTGIDYRYDYLNNTKITSGDRHEVNADIFAQYDWIINDRWEVVGVARYDYFSGNHISRVTPKLSARYKPSYNTVIRMAYGMGFRTPTLKEKYYNFDMAGIWIVVGNPELKSESSQNVNASFEWWHKYYSVTVTGYYNYVSNKIATGLPYYLPEDSRQLYLDYINLDSYNVLGAETTLQAKWPCGIGAKLSYAYTYEMFPKDKEGNAANNQYLPARKNSLTTHVEWNHEFSKTYSLTAGVSGRFLSGVTNPEYKDYYDVSEGTTDVYYPAYTLWKLSVSQTFWKRARLTIALDNLFNYRPKYYYMNAPLTDGINLQVGISVDID